MSPAGAFLGKFRGVVTSTDDPLALGRIKARVPDVFGDDDSGWALPCAPFGGREMGWFALPAVGAGVWMEFEQGDPGYPVWSGCWWSTADELPAALKPSAAQKVLIQTRGGHSVLIDDTPGSGGITLQTKDGSKIVLGASGVEITNGQGASVKLSSTQVSVNDGALEVT